MFEIKDVVEFNLNLNLSQLADFDKKIERKFGKFSFSCGCGEVHSISEYHPYGVKSVTALGDPTLTVSPIVTEKNRILYNCKHGYLTMVSLSGGIFKKEIKTDFFIKREIIDNSNDGFGLNISTNNYNLDFNSTRKSKVPTRQILKWKDFENEITKFKENEIEIFPLHDDGEGEFLFDCACGRRHNLLGSRADWGFNQKHFGGYSKGVLVAGKTKMLTTCSEGYYCMFQLRPSSPIEWFIKLKTKNVDGYSIPILPKEIKKSTLYPKVLKHIEYIHFRAEHFRA